MAHAAPCCVLPGTATPGVLAAGEVAGVAFGASANAWLGDWTRDGRVLGRDGSAWYRSNLEARALGRVGRAVQLDAGARALHETLDLQGEHDTALGLESLDAGIRWDAGREGTTTRPVALGSIRRIGGADASWEGQLGASLEGTRPRGPWAASATVARGRALTRGQARAALGWTLTPALDLHVSAGLALESRGGVTGFAPTLSLAVPWRTSRARVIPVVTVAPLVPGLGRSTPAWAGLGVSVLAAR